MMAHNTTEFDEIRPYHDEELAGIFEELIADPSFREVVGVVYPDVPFEALARKMRACRTKWEFQRVFCYPLLKQLADKCTAGLSLDYSAMKDPSKAYTYVSNHRDIILDSGFLSILLVDAGMDTVEIAIGDNLLIYPWIKKLVRVNKAFIVQRALTMRQMLESSVRMSRYMHHTIRDKNQSIWIAQREGRAKDSNDLTQDSVLKMIALGGEGSVVESLMEMNITPLSLSYEYDPCDYLKALEFQLKRDCPDYKKTEADDLLNMKTGLFGYKGRVHIQLGACINDRLAGLDASSMSKSEIYAQVSKWIDHEIHSNYRLYPGNYIAYDLLKGGFPDFAGKMYSLEDEQRFSLYIQEQLRKIDMEDKDIAFLRERMLTMYANPLRNYLAATR